MVKKIDVLEARGTKWDPVRVKEDEAGRKINDFTTRLVRIKGEEELLVFKRKLIANLIKQLESIPPSRSYNLSKYMREQGESDKPLRQQIIDVIRRDNERSGIDVVEEDGKLVMRVYINHDLAIALNDGTGTHNKNTGREITPKHKDYMFIPGGQFAKGYFMRKYSKMGLSAADAKGRFEYGMVHNNLVRLKKAKG